MATHFMRFPGGRERALTFSYDDGIEQDIRLISIFKKYGLKATFNLNSGSYAPEGHVWPEGELHRRLPASTMNEMYVKDGMEVAVHTLTHPYLEKLSPYEIVYEVMQDRANLEQQFGTVVRGMAYPFGTYSDEVVECLAKCGIAYSRTVESTHNFKIPTDWLRMPATCHHNDPQLMELADKFLAPNRHPCDFDPRLFYVWGHAYEFEGNDNWEVIENFAAKMAGHDEIWYATNIEIYDYIEAYHRLQFSANSKRVHNPNAVPIWFTTGEKETFRTVVVEPGQTLSLE